jgi:rRNA biogenesis protein RRP5
MVEVSLRQSRLEGDLDEDEVPDIKDTVQAYVVETNRKGCFVRLSRGVQGRVILKELSDGFLPDPAASFPVGRLVVGKVKEIHPAGKSKKHNKAKTTVDLDMRESILLDSDDKLSFEDVELNSKHKATVTRLETYGVFVRLENSDVSGLVHKSECSDKYIKSLADLYDPGDLVKVLVVKKDDDGKKIGFSMKASHFLDDEDSDDDGSIDDEEMEDAGHAEESEDEDGEADDDLDSDDENFMAKLAAKTANEDDSGTDEDDNEEEEADDNSDEDDDEDDSDSDDGKKKTAMDTDVGFDWGTGQGKPQEDDDDSSDDSDSDSDSGDDDDDEDAASGKGHSSRKKAAARRREEQDIARREIALADGTADENPETPADFERLLASEPNNSEHWIRFMAFHLSLADLESARRIAQRAFDRMDFRQEREKLNVWTALLTMELKYGSGGSFQDTIEKACQSNNPKQVYLRVCEMLEKDKIASGASLEATKRTDEMFTKMCKKFRSKKTVWIAHLNYLLQGGRHMEAQALLKRALTSLPDYKHVETMSKFAQLEFELGSVERGRTVFDGLLEKYPKKMDLLFVYVDKEVKSGDMAAARALLERTCSANAKLSDKQMKALFKKWYRIEELHGDEGSQEHVKDAARSYVERSSK